MISESKANLITATAKVAQQHGVQHLTLEAVAQAAGVSKGGLLYHYPTKDHLLIALTEYAIAAFRDALNRHHAAGASLHEAYVLATQDGLASEEHLMHHSSGLLLAAASSPEALALWHTEYAQLAALLAAEPVEKPISLLVQTACDGVWFQAVLGQHEHPAANLGLVLQALLQVLRTEIM